MNKNKLQATTSFILALALAGCSLPGVSAPTQPENTPTSTPPNTLVPPTETQIPPTATLIPTQTLEPTPTEIAPVYMSSVYTGEFPLNNLGAVGTDQMVASMMQGLKTIDRGQNPSRLDSTFTSLTNDFSSKLFGTDPLTEPGFGQNSADIGNFLDVKDVIVNRDTFTLSELLTLNDGGILTTEIVGQEDDRDAALAVLAVQQAFVSHKLNGFTGEDTLQEVFDSPEAVKVVEKIQSEMFGMIQEKFLDVSFQEEQIRIIGNSTEDASVGLPVDLQKPDQSISCDVYRTPADAREDQLQALRKVTHSTDIKTDSFTEANSGTEQTLWILGFDPATGKHKVAAFTSRAYVGPVAGQEISASGEQKLACGEGETNHESKPNKPQNENHEKGPNPGNGTDRGTGSTEDPGTGTNEH